MPKKPGVSYSKSKVRNSSFGAGQGSTEPPVQKDANQIKPPYQQTRYPKSGGKASKPSMRR